MKRPIDEDRFSIMNYVLFTSLKPWGLKWAFKSDLEHYLRDRDHSATVVLLAALESQNVHHRSSKLTVNK